MSPLLAVIAFSVRFTPSSLLYFCSKILGEHLFYGRSPRIGEKRPTSPFSREDSDMHVHYVSGATVRSFWWKASQTSFYEWSRRRALSNLVRCGEHYTFFYLRSFFRFAMCLHKLMWVNCAILLLPNILLLCFLSSQ